MKKIEFWNRGDEVIDVQLPGFAHAKLQPNERVALVCDANQNQKDAKLLPAEKFTYPAASESHTTGSDPNPGNLRLSPSADVSHQADVNQSHETHGKKTHDK